MQRVFFILLLLGAQCAHAQDRWQLKAGASQIRCNDPLGSEHLSRTGRKVYGMGVHGGAGYEHPLSRTLGWRAELLGSVRRIGYDLAQADLPYRSPVSGASFSYGKRTMELTQVEVPVALVLRKWDLLRLDAGTSVAYLLAAEERWSGSADGVQQSDALDRTAAIPRLEFALIVGAEVESGRRLGMVIRYKHGLTDLDSVIRTTPSVPRSWELSLSYALGALAAERDDAPFDQ